MTLFVTTSFAVVACAVGPAACGERYDDHGDEIVDILDADHEETDATDATSCFLDEHLGKIWTKSVGSGIPEELWFAPLHGGYLVGRILTGPRASPDCFELRWELADCSAEQAMIQIEGLCNFNPTQIQLTVVPEDQIIDSFRTLRVNSILYEVLFDAHPSELDRDCATYVCNTQWLGD